MNRKQKKEYIYSAMKDIYNEFNHSLNCLIIIREFLQDLLSVKEGKNPNIETKSSLKNCK